ncbi:MAG: sugar phosphate isomerase/epimerase [Pirellulaceae bacterium]|nr:sugar phosphate isomerase/epimerase [Pirellulaceae bacterium]
MTMSKVLDRRDFAMQSSLLAGGIALGLRGADSQLQAIEPIRRNGTPAFKFSIAAYSYRSLLTGENPPLELADFINDCAALGIEGTELTSYYFPPDVTVDYIRTLKEQCFRLGLDVSGTAIGNDFGYQGEQRQEQIDHVKQWIDYAEILGAPVIRIFAGHAHDDVNPTEAHGLMVSAIEECCDYAGQHGVYLALENHGGPTATAAGLLAFVRDVKSPWFGVNLDTGNFHSEDVYGELEQVAPYAVNVQVKVVVSGPDKKKVPTNFKRLAQIMRDVNYRGYIVLEYEESGNPREACPPFIEDLREAFG